MADQTSSADFSQMDNSGITPEHWKIMFISGMGFFTDAYDLFIIGVVMALLKPMWSRRHLKESPRFLQANGRQEDESGKITSIDGKQDQSVSF